MSTQAFNQTYYEPNERTRRVDSIAWAVFFIWVGVAIVIVAERERRRRVIS